MAITKSAKKAIRSGERKAVYNLRRERKYKTIIKEVEALIKGKKIAEAEKKISEAYQAIDKAAKMKTIDKNTASRKKSRLSQKIKKAKNAGK